MPDLTLTNFTPGGQRFARDGALLYKYSVSHLVWTSRRVEAPTQVELTPRQQILLREPGDPLRHFPSLFEEAAV